MCCEIHELAVSSTQTFSGSPVIRPIFGMNCGGRDAWLFARTCRTVMGHHSLRDRPLDAGRGSQQAEGANVSACDWLLGPKATRFPIIADCGHCPLRGAERFETTRPADVIARARARTDGADFDRFKHRQLRVHARGPIENGGSRLAIRCARGRSVGLTSGFTTLQRGIQIPQGC